MSTDPQYPLPHNLLTQAEHLMQDLPDREDTVFLLRRFLGQVYAQGWQDGSLAESLRSHYDQRAPKVVPGD